MNDFDAELTRAVAPTAGFGAANVAARVVERRRRRWRRRGAVAGLVLVVGATVAVATLAGDDGTDLEAFDVPPTTTIDGPARPAELEFVAEDPVGADGAAGALTDLHVETTDDYGFARCGADGEPGPPAGERAAELEALIESLRNDGFHEQPFASSSGGPQSIWGVPSLGLSARYEPTLEWIADRADPADVCIEFPEFGVRNLPPELARVVIAPVDGAWTVIAEGCQPKGEWVQPFVRRGSDLAELGIAVGRGQREFTDDCPAPTEYGFAEPDSRVGVLATEPGTLFFEGVASPGGPIDFTFDPDNVASDSTIGDDLIAQHVDDATVQFQVSDIFSGSPVAGSVGEVATDQWPITGTGTIVVPDGVPAGTYFVRSISDPELNGRIEIESDPAGDQESSLGPEWGWRVPDLDGDGEGDVVDGTNGQVFLTHLGGVMPLLDEAGALVSVAVEGAEVFTCNPDGSLLRQWDDEVGDEFARRTARLDILDGVAAWTPSPSFFHPGWGLPLRASGCEVFGSVPTDDGGDDRIEGPLTDIHVEAVELVFPDCETLPQDGVIDEDRRAATLDRLISAGVRDQPFINSVGSFGGFVDAVDVILQRRHGPTLDWLAARAEPDEVCLLLLPPPGFYTQPPSFHTWEVVGEIDPDDTAITLARAPGECVSGGEHYSPIVREHADRIEIALPVARTPAGVALAICLGGGEETVSLRAPIGGREVVPFDGPTVRLSPDLAEAPVDVPFTVLFDPSDLGTESTMGDDVMLQSLDDPTTQVQIDGVFTTAPIAGEPRPLVADRWDATGSAQLIVPVDLPAGRYTYVFVEHPQLWGTLEII